jgi:hypothetical protein
MLSENLTREFEENGINMGHYVSPLASVLGNLPQGQLHRRSPS